MAMPSLEQIYMLSAKVGIDVSSYVSTNRQMYESNSFYSLPIDKYRQE